MAQQSAANKKTPLLSPIHLRPFMEQQVEGRNARTNPSSPGSNTVIQPSIEGELLSSSTSSGSSTIAQLDDEDESAPLLLSASQHSTIEHQLEEREPYPSATFDPPRVEDESEHRLFSGQMHSDTEHQLEHSPSSLSTSGELSPVVQHSVGDHSTSNTFAQQVNIQQQRPFSLSDPMQSSIMLRRNPHAESASAGRSSTSKKTLQNVNPKRVRQLINTLGFDDQRSEMFYKLVLATAPFRNIESLSTPPAPENRDPKADDALREALDTLIFAPKPASPIASPLATVAEEGSLVDHGSSNPTTNVLFGANAAENLGPCPPEASSESPPLLWSTAAAEDSLDPNAEDPTHFTVAEFLNTIIENGIQVESVTDEDWWIEEMRVKILDRLERDISEGVPTDEEDSDEVVMTKDEATKEVKAKETKSEEIKAEEIKATETKAEEIKAEEIKDEEIRAEETKADVIEADEIKAEGVKAKEVTSESDMQRWKEQGPGGWLRKESGADMNEEEIDEECARWDAMVMEARSEKEAGKGSGFYSPSVYSEHSTDIIRQWRESAGQIDNKS